MATDKLVDFDHVTDYISRQAAINIVCHDDCEDCPDGGCDMYRRMKRLPAADVRPVVRGKWKFEIGDGKTCVDGWVCSNCNCGFHTNVPYFEGFNFCPNCGAMMEDNLDTTKGERRDESSG